ncbi:hypothetical protein CEXT_191611 [Caerostris extrusa]|uniref:Uncharacterized protein n=1 Tax=Caerostris extrusa TaxID=172846 RepID=A0AAV4RC31_CAEEX|nr:hypothetical protein CEXT_191611 [Caerostris extrusa]
MGSEGRRCKGLEAKQDAFRRNLLLPDQEKVRRRRTRRITRTQGQSLLLFIVYALGRCAAEAVFELLEISISVDRELISALKI